jgi:hypothetical protein
MGGPFQILGGGPVGLVTGDFNNDGILDLALIGVYAEGLSGPVAILLGNGDGTFTLAEPQPSVTLVNPVWATAGDFNGSNALTILLGNGDGTFTQVSGEPALPQFSNFVTTADLNGDGKLDLVFSNSCGYSCTANTISIFLGNGDGTFQPGFSEAVGNDPQAIGVGDFNGDGRLDLAVTNSSDNTISILLQPTFASLIKLVKQYDTKPNVAAIMVFTLELAQGAESSHAAKVADALLDAFIDEVSEQSGKSLTAAQAAILIQDAKALMMPT